MLPLNLTATLLEYKTAQTGEGLLLRNGIFLYIRKNVYEK